LASIYSQRLKTRHSKIMRSVRPTHPPTDECRLENFPFVYILIQVSCIYRTSHRMK